MSGWLNILKDAKRWRTLMGCLEQSNGGDTGKVTEVVRLPVYRPLIPVFEPEIIPAPLDTIERVTREILFKWYETDQPCPTLTSVIDKIADETQPDQLSHADKFKEDENEDQRLFPRAYQRDESSY
jgi:hypothetical protein